LFVVELIGSVLKVMMSTFELCFEVAFLSSACSNVGLVLSNDTLESGDSKIPFCKFTVVDFNFMFKLEFQFSSGNGSTDLVFLSMSNLSFNCNLKTSEDFQKFSFNITPLLSFSTFETIQIKFSLIVINVVRTDFIAGSSVNALVNINFVIGSNLLLELNEFRKVASSVNSQERLKVVHEGFTLSEVKGILVLNLNSKELNERQSNLVVLD